MPHNLPIYSSTPLSPALALGKLKLISYTQTKFKKKVKKCKDINLSVILTKENLETIGKCLNMFC